jgi:glycosyltransferase involved in cell wall biosynthesis
MAPDIRSRPLGSRRAPTPVAASIVVPTIGRADYLDVTLRSLLAQDVAVPYEIVVVDDGSTDRTPEVAAQAGVRLVRHAMRRSVNAARNTGIDASHAQLIAFVDDDVHVPRSWLRALLEGAARHPDAEAFGGPIRPRLEGRAPRGCGRDAPLVTSLDLGDADTPTDRAWGANLAVRRAAFERVGCFDETIVEPSGDEEEWLVRLKEAGGRVVYLAAAGLDHRRAPHDSGLRPLARAAFSRGLAARASDRRRGVEPALPRELRTLAGCVWHSVRRTCPQGLVMASHSAGRLVAGLRER